MSDSTELTVNCLIQDQSAILLLFPFKAGALKILLIIITLKNNTNESQVAAVALDRLMAAVWSWSPV